MTTKTDIALLRCPFCGGQAEMDTRQGYRALGTGRMGNRIAIYCRSCDADMGVCIEDVPDITPEQVAEMWNRRAAVEADRRDHVRGAASVIPVPTTKAEYIALLDLVARLRALARFEHDDVSVADEAADALISGKPAASAEPCFCDRMYPDSNPDATCGDCPRDYRPAAPVATQTQTCNHVYEARPIDGTTRASVQCEPVCRKCGYRPAVRAAKGDKHEN